MTVKTKKTLEYRLTQIGACRDAVEWAKDFRSAQAAWNACERGDWMLWVVGRTINCGPWSDGRKPLLACSLDCAETVKHLRSERQRRKIGEAVAVLRRWIAGEATNDQAVKARKMLWAAASADAASADAAFAFAAAFAAAAAATSADAASADAAAYYAFSASRRKSLKQCADIVRQHYPKPPEVKVS